MAKTLEEIRRDQQMMEQLDRQEMSSLFSQKPSYNPLPQGSLQGTLSQPAQPKQASLSEFASVMRAISESAYDYRQGKETKNLGFDPSKVSGSIFRQVMDNLESSRGSDISKIYSSAVDTAKADIAQQEAERERQLELQKEEERKREWEIEMQAKYPDMAVGFTNVEGLRTDRHNNPTAFTVDIARQAGLVEGVDYAVGDPFTSGNGTYYTAKIIGNPIETTIRVIDNIGFYTQSGQPRWSYVDQIPQAQNWANLNFNEKAEVIKQMYKREGGNGSLFGLTGNQQNLTKDQKQAIMQLSDDVRVDPDIKTFVEIRDGYERVQTGADLNNAQGDLALLFGYMKILDPTSVVRETEFANAESAMGYAQKALNMPNKWIKGTRLTEEARQFFAKSAQNLYSRKEESYQRAYDAFVQKAQAFGVDPNLVLRDYRTTINSGSTANYTEADSAYVKSLGF